MTNLFNIVDRTAYRNALDAGYIKVQKHPNLNYYIHNYTDAATWDQAWDEATLNCRGMITDDDNNVIARGMPKFFNSDQEQAPKFALDDKVIVSDKADGSLGILYYLPDFTEAIATRGSFASDQAIWATNWWRENRPDIALIAGETYLFEIIYPDNRIVVDYNGKEGLVFLGTVNKETGIFTPAWVPEIDCATRYSYETWGEVLEAPTRENAEGFVVTRPADGAMVKIKYEDYKRLHKYMTRVNEKHVWEALSTDKDLDAEFAGAPDEFHVWIRAVAADLHAAFEKRHIELIKAYREIMFGPLEKTFTYPHVEEREAKKNFALAVKDEKDKGYFFMMYEDRTTIPMIWKELKPTGGNTFRVVSSDSD